MKKRIVSIMLLTMMLVTMVTTASCGKKDPADTLELDGKSANAMTLTIWGIKGKGTTDEAVEAVEAEISKLTQAKFNTAIELNLYFEDEYEEAVTAKLDEIQARVEAEEAEKAAKKKAEREARKAGKKVETEAATEETTEPADETMKDEYGLEVTKYPEVGENQLDIFLLTDYDMIMAMEEKGVLSSLDEEISGSSKLLKQYIHPTLIEAGKVNGKTVAILNQQQIGEATYMLVDKNVLNDLNAKYGAESSDYSITKISRLHNLQVVVAQSYLENAVPFISKAAEEYAADPEFEALVGDLSAIALNYFSMDGSRTLFGHMLNPAIHSYGEAFEPRFMLDNNPVFTHYLTYMKQFELRKCYDEEFEAFTPEDKFAVGIMKGGAAQIAQFEPGYIQYVRDNAGITDDDAVPYYEGENYYVLQIQAPQGNADDIYNGAFAVSTFTKNVGRSMEVVTYLNTRTDIRNLFAYGIEGVHYEIDEIDGSLVKLSDDYNMILEYTGNCFIAHAPYDQPTIVENEQGVSEEVDYWGDAKLHNLELELTPFFNFKLTEEDVDMDLYNYAMEFSNKFYAEWDAITSEDQIDPLLLKYYNQGIADQDLMNWISEAPVVEEGEESPLTLGKFYLGWFNRNIK